MKIEKDLKRSAGYPDLSRDHCIYGRGKAWWDCKGKRRREDPISEDPAFSWSCSRDIGACNYFHDAAQIKAKSTHRERFTESETERKDLVCFGFFKSSFLLSAPGVVTMIFSGVITRAPLAVAAPLNMASTISLNLSTTGPPVIVLLRISVLSNVASL